MPHALHSIRAKPIDKTPAANYLSSVYFLANRETATGCVFALFIRRPTIRGPTSIIFWGRPILNEWRVHWMGFLKRGEWGKSGIETPVLRSFPPSHVSSSNPAFFFARYLTRAQGYNWRLAEISIDLVTEKL